MNRIPRNFLKRSGDQFVLAAKVYFGVCLCVCFSVGFSGFVRDVSAQEKKLQEANQQEFDQTDILRAMSLTSKAFRVAAKKIQPCLVTIESYGGVSAVQGRIGGIRAQGEGNTTGVMISSDGYILTSTFNFVQQPPVISVVTSDGERRFAKLLGRDDTRKICLLKIDGVTDMPVPESVDPKELRIGQWALTLGVGYGDTSPAMSMGIISATNRVGGRAVQTDANISPANYGGALIDLKGRLIGICVPLNPQSQAVGAGVEWYDSGIGFAIPMREIEKVIKRLKTGEKIMPGFIGVIAIPNPQGKGLFIQRVYQDTAASEVGLLVEDIILQINGTKVNDLLTFKSLLSKYEVGESVELTILKSGDADENPVNLTVELGSPPKPKNEPESLEPPKIR